MGGLKGSLSSLLVLSIAAILSFAVLNVGAVSAAHTATITITPDIANCDGLGDTFTVNVKNDAGSVHEILQVEIYKASTGISDFICGTAPSGWTLFSYVDRCIYVTGLDSADKIAPGASLDFKFDAIMSSNACASEFIIVTVDDAFPIGGRNTYPVDVEIDCTPPVIQKIVGDPKIPGEGFDWWLRQDSLITLSASDDTDECDLGVDYCIYRITVDGVPGDWILVDNGEVLDWEFYFKEDSEHYLEVECSDKAGNNATLTETDKVDSTPPETEKTYGIPRYPEGMNDGAAYPHWITTDTLITLDAGDPEAPTTPPGVDCSSGIDKTWWYDQIVDDRYCQSEEACQTWNVCPTPYDPCDCGFGNPNGMECVNNAQEICEDIPAMCDNYWAILDYANYDECIADLPTWEDCVEKAVNSVPPSEDNPNGIGCVSCACESNWQLYRDVPFQKPEESCHIIQFFSVDGIGNIETLHKQCVFVDNTPPAGIKEIIGPKMEGDGETFDWWVGGGAEIRLSCEDQLPHPVDHDQVCYRILLDGGVQVDWTCVDAPKVIEFTEDSNHQLDFYCRDALGNTGQIDSEKFKVDTTPPEIDKEMFGNWLGDCPPGDPSDICYVADNGESGVNVTVTDGGEICAVNDITCRYKVTWFNPDPVIVDSGSFSDFTQIIFAEDSTHELYIECSDALGNSVSDTETFLVDSTPPVTTKTYGQPTIVGDGFRWISSSTPITLGATDNKVGVDKISYRVTLLNVDEEDCPEACEMNEGVSGSGEWTTIQGSSTLFTIPQDSCHLIEFYSVDRLNNAENQKHQCVFVDNLPPVTTKTIGEPKVVNGDNYISQQTPITLSCEDQLPHPVDQVTLKYRYRYATECSGLPGASWSEWTTYAGTITFQEDSCHQLEYYCVDALGNQEQTQSEIDIVDTKAPEITKTMEGPWYGVCPPEPIIPDAVSIVQPCYVDSATKVHITAADPEPHPVDEVSCTWRYMVNDGKWSEWNDSMTITFPEESFHTVEIICSDALGNANTETEQFIADHTPPGITKRYGEPFKAFETQDYWAEWISIKTPVFILVTDDGPHKSGIKEVQYRTTLVDNEYCFNRQEDDVTCEDAAGSGSWLPGSEEFNFTIPQDSCHMIEIKATDNVGKSSTHKQCVFVDNKGPEPIKTVGEPKAEWDGKDSVFYPGIGELCWNGEEDGIECWKVTTLTPIVLDCKDREPHPVDHESICFNVNFDAMEYTENYCEGGELIEDPEVEGKMWCCGDKTEDGIQLRLAEESEHNLEFYCTDALGNKGEVDEEKFKVEGTAFKVPIFKKWNLISVPFVLFDSSPEKVFDNVSDKIAAVWTYDAETGTWHGYSPDAADLPDGTPNDLTSVDPGWGYWVLAKEDGEFKIAGSMFKPGPYVPVSRFLPEGWNLIGYYGTDWQEYDESVDPCIYGREMPFKNYAYNSLYSLMEEVYVPEPGFSLNGETAKPNWRSLWTYQTCGIDNPPVQPYWLPIDYDEFMYPGYGYWIFMNQDDVYAPSFKMMEVNV